MMARRAALIVLAIGCTSSDVGAQTAPEGWYAAAGGGISFGTSADDRTTTEGPGAGAQLLIGRERTGHGFGALVQATWLGGRYDEKRHLLAGVLTLRPAGLPVILLGGIGVGIATIIEVDGPPSPPAVGDALVSIGDQGAIGLVVGAALDIPVTSGIGIEPTFDLIVHHADGRNLGTGLLGARLRFR